MAAWSKCQDRTGLPVASQVITVRRQSRRRKRNASSTNQSWVGLIRSGPTFASQNLT